MKIGAIIKIKKCETMPEVAGETAELVGMQTQEFEKYTVYPLWVKMLTGEREGKTYGFKYEEVEVLPEAYAEERTETKVVEQMEEILAGLLR